MLTDKKAKQMRYAAWDRNDVEQLLDSLIDELCDRDSVRPTIALLIGLGVNDEHLTGMGFETRDICAAKEWLESDINETIDMC